MLKKRQWILPLFLFCILICGTSFLFKFFIGKEDFEEDLEHSDFPILKVSKNLELTGRFKHFLYLKPYLYVSMNLDGLYIYDCSDPGNPDLVKKWDGDVGVNPIKIEYFDGKFYIADRFKGFVIMDAQNPLEPEILSESAVNGIASSVDVKFPYALVSCGGKGVTLFDITDATMPVVFSKYDQLIDYTAHASIAEDTYYLADNFFGGLKVLNMQEGELRLQKSYDLKGFVDKIHIDLDRAYSVTRQQGVVAFDISDRLNPALIYKIYAGEDAMTDILINGDLLFATYKYFGLKVFDISNEDAPVFLEEYYLGEKTETLCLVENYLYVANTDHGISIFECPI